MALQGVQLYTTIGVVDFSRVVLAAVGRCRWMRAKTHREHHPPGGPHPLFLFRVFKRRKNFPFEKSANLCEPKNFRGLHGK